MSGTVRNVSNTLEDWRIIDVSLYMENCLTITHILCTFIGIPYNILVMTTIICCRRFHSSRHFTWLGTGFSNVLILVYYMTESLAVSLESPIAGQICAWLFGLPQSSLVLNHFLSLLERYLSLKHSNWYKRRVINCWIVLACQLVLLSALFLINEWLLAYRSVPLQWPPIQSDVNAAVILFLSGIGLYLAFQAALWTISNQNYPSVSPIEIYLQPLDSCRMETETPSEDMGKIYSAFVRIGSERISRLDLEAARSVNINGLLMAIFVVPSLLGFAAIARCRHDMSLSLKCVHLFTVSVYLRELIPIYSSFVNPTTFLFLNRDIRSFVREFKFIGYFFSKPSPNCLPDDYYS